MSKHKEEGGGNGGMTRRKTPAVSGEDFRIGSGDLESVLQYSKRDDGHGQSDNEKNGIVRTTFYKN